MPYAIDISVRKKNNLHLLLAVLGWVVTIITIEAFAYLKSPPEFFWTLGITPAIFGSLVIILGVQDYWRERDAIRWIEEIQKRGQTQGGE